MDLQVYGVPDKRMGEEACASVVVKEGSTITVDDIRAYCKGRVNIRRLLIPRSPGSLIRLCILLFSDRSFQGAQVHIHREGRAPQDAVRQSAKVQIETVGVETDFGRTLKRSCSCRTVYSLLLYHRRNATYKRASRQRKNYISNVLIILCITSQTSARTSIYCRTHIIYSRKLTARKPIIRKYESGK